MPVCKKTGRLLVMNLVGVAKPRALDLFCCAGGATRGYQMAGFHVTGVDIKPRPNYCGDAFEHMGAIAFVNRHGKKFHFIHSSPPCQAGSTLTRGTNKARGVGANHEQLVPITREALEATGKPYVIEQPTGHGGLIRADLRLCMDMFRIPEPPRVQRHRDFEIFGFTVEQPAHVKHQGYVRGWRNGLYRSGDYISAYGTGGGKGTVWEMQHALGIDWTDLREELTEAIPPAYTRYIGEQFLKGLANV